MNDPRVVGVNTLVTSQTQTMPGILHVIIQSVRKGVPMLHRTALAFLLSTSPKLTWCQGGFSREWDRLSFGNQSILKVAFNPLPMPNVSKWDPLVPHANIQTPEYDYSYTQNPEECARSPCSTESIQKRIICLSRFLCCQDWPGKNVWCYHQTPEYGFGYRCFGRFYMRTATQPVVAGEKWEQVFCSCPESYSTEKF